MLLLAGIWPGLAGAGALGLAVGWLAGWPERAAVPLAPLGLAAALGALALAGAVPGLPGLWLESAAALLPPYLAGCGLGALARRRTARV